MNLTPHFTLEELTHSDYAVRYGLDNTPSTLIVSNLRRTAALLEKVRTILGHPIHVSSGYRSPQVNAGVRGASTSSHLTGNAADIRCDGFGPPTLIFNKLREYRSLLLWDQLILEYPKSQNGGWVHIAAADIPRGQVLVYDGKEYKSA